MNDLAKLKRVLKKQLELAAGLQMNIGSVYARNMLITSIISALEDNTPIVQEADKEQNESESNL